MKGKLSTLYFIKNIAQHQVSDGENSDSEDNNHENSDDEPFVDLNYEESLEG
jgi:hypothetical protein